MTYGGISFGSFSLVSSSLLGEGVVACEEGHETFNAVATKCEQACRILTDLYQRNPMHRDLVPSYEALQAWPFIVTAYSGIEQSIKVLLKMSRIEYPSNGRAGHRLDKLFDKLPDIEQTIIRKSFDVYQSLHYYIDFASVDDFLRSISVGFGSTGYDDWRYLLMDFQASLVSARVPVNHAGAMLEVWAALADILVAKTVVDHRLNTVADRIDHGITSCINDTSDQQPYSFNHEQFNDLAGWLHSLGNKITSYANFYHNTLRSRPATPPMTQHTKNFLEASIPYARQLAEKDQDFSLFLQLAERTTVKWDETTKRFNLG